MLLEPVLVGLHREGPHQPQTAVAIREDAHDVGAGASVRDRTMVIQKKIPAQLKLSVKSRPIAMHNRRS